MPTLKATFSATNFFQSKSEMQASLGLLLIAETFGSDRLLIGRAFTATRASTGARFGTALVHWRYVIPSHLSLSTKVEKKPPLLISVLFYFFISFFFLLLYETHGTEM